MSRRDDLHFPVRRALLKEGWTITHDPIVIAFKDLSLKVESAMYDEYIQDEQTAFHAIVERKRINLIVCDIEREVILQWIKQ